MHISWVRLASFCHLSFISDPLIVKVCHLKIIIHFFLVVLSSDCTIVQAEAFSTGFWFKTFIRKYVSNYSLKSFSVAKSVSERMLHKDIQEC